MKYFSEFLYEANKSGDSSLRDWFTKSRASDGTPGWVQLGGKYAGKPCAKQPGQTTKPKCGSSKMKANLSDAEEEKAFRRKNRQDPNPDRKGKAKNVATEEVKKDHEFSMARSQLKTLKNAANRLQKKMGKRGEGELKAWVQSKITKATDYIDTAADYVTNEQYITQQQKAERMAQSFVNKARGVATRYDAAKKAAQKVKTTPGSVTIRSNIPEGVVEEGKKDACYHKVKARYDVWPSAYASGALVKCRKKGAKNWGNKTKKEEVQYENYSRIQSRGTTYSILLNWMGRVLSVQMFFPKFTRPTKEEVTFEVKKLYPGARVLSFNPSLKDPTKPLLYTGDTQ